MFYREMTNNFITPLNQLRLLDGVYVLDLTRIRDCLLSSVISLYLSKPYCCCVFRCSMYTVRSRAFCCTTHLNGFHDLFVKAIECNISTRQTVLHYFANFECRCVAECFFSLAKFEVFSNVTKQSRVLDMFSYRK